MMHHIKRLIILLLPIVFLAMYCAPLYAFTISNDNYILQINPALKDPQEANAPTTPSAPPIRKPILPFGVTISQSFIDFGILSPTYPVIRTNNISITKGSASGYQLLAFNDHPLENSAKNIIPDTSCNSGSCTTTLSEPWTSTLSYGLGYRCDLETQGCNAFLDSNSFMRFAHEGDAEQPYAMIKSVKSLEQAQITYKLNISKTQNQGFYTNTITYLAIPMY